MRKDFDLITHKFGPGIKKLTIYPFADLHIGSETANEKLWRQLKSHIMSDPTAYIVIAGDNMNNALKSSVSNCYTETMRPLSQKRWVADELRDIRSKILCIVPGNHERRSLKDADDEPLYDVACKLDLEDIYRPSMAFVKISFGTNSKNRSNTYTLCATHGTGGGVLTGGSVNRTNGAKTGGDSGARREGALCKGQHFGQWPP